MSLLSRRITNLTAGANGRVMLIMLRNRSGGECKPHTHVQYTHWVFAVENKNPFCWAQRIYGDLQLAFYCNHVPGAVTDTSSAINDETNGQTALNIPLMVTANRVTHKTDPCGTPFS
jgi:hypothetical protein